MKQCAVCGKIEYPGDVKLYAVELKRCSACKAAYYCSKSCQKQDWATHKLHCNIPQKPPKKPRCGLCRNATGPLTRTECCNRLVCDDLSNYELFSYGRNSCRRNHDRYTVCSYHHDRQHGTLDWKNCEQCKSGLGLYEFVQRGINPKGASGKYNFGDNVLINPPHVEHPKCSKCNRPIITRDEGFTQSWKNGVEILQCTTCSPL